MADLWGVVGWCSLRRGEEKEEGEEEGRGEVRELLDGAFGALWLLGLGGGCLWGGIIRMGDVKRLGSQLDGSVELASLRVGQVMSRRAENC